MKSNAQTRDAQRDVLECIRDFTKQHQYAPTIAEICRICGFKSKGTIAVHLRALRDQRLLTWQPGCERTFVITDRAWAALKVLEAFLDMTGTKAEKRAARRYLMRLVLAKPWVSVAIEDLLASQGFTPDDAVKSHIALIRGVETVRFTPDGKYMKFKEPPSLAALRDYWEMIGWLR